LMGVLAARERMQPPSMTRIVNGLEDRGYVARRPDPSDRRQCLVTVTATGLGAYIKDATSEGNSAHTLIGVIVMSFYVVAMNRFFWRRLYAISERRFSLS